jgi:hypothetical protein
MQMIFVNRAKYAILPLLQPTKKRSAYIEQRVTLCIARPSHRRCCVRFAAPTFKAKEPFSMRQLIVANRRFGLKPEPLVGARMSAFTSSGQTAVRALFCFVPLPDSCSAAKRRS